MAITIYSEEETCKLALAYFSEAFPGKALGPHSFLGQQARALAQLVGALQQAIADADGDAVPAYVSAAGELRSRCSSQALENWAFVYGLPSNRGNGVLGRNAAQRARGGTVLIKGVPSTLIPAGSRLIDSTGQVAVELSSAVTLGAGGTIASVEAVTPGTIGNLPAGLLLRFQAPPPGVSSSCVLITPLSGGIEEEEDLALLARLLRRLQAPPKGGTPSDIRVFAEQALDSTGQLVGIQRAYVYPHRDGVGTYDVVIELGGVGSERIPSVQQQAMVQAHLDALRVVTDTARVVLPRVEQSEMLRIWITCLPAPRYPFDWQDGGVPREVISATNTTWVVRGPAATSLFAAVDAYSNRITQEPPRLQLCIPASSPLPVQVSVTAYAANTPAPGQTTLTVLPLPDGALPPMGTVFFAGGPVVPLVAPSLLAALGRVGPSRSSGYADPLDRWEDTVSISRLTSEALGTLGKDGQPVLLSSPGVGLGVGIRIAVGAGSYTGQDIALFDNLPGQGPQIPACSHLYITGA